MQTKSIYKPNTVREQGVHYYTPFKNSVLNTPGQQMEFPADQFIGIVKLCFLCINVSVTQESLLLLSKVCI